MNVDENKSPRPADHFVSESCHGEPCSVCDNPATHKVGEEIGRDDPHFTHRHNFTAYICCDCFTKLFGTATYCSEKIGV